MAKELPYYPMYVDDFNGSRRVEEMSAADIGIYVLCLNESWKRGSIPDDPEKVSIVIRRRLAEVKKSWPLVRECFIPNCVPGRLVNERQETERKKAEKIRAQASDRMQRFRNANVTRNETRTLRVQTPLRYALRSIELSSSNTSEEYSLLDANANATRNERVALYSKFDEFLSNWPEINRRGVDLGAQMWISLVDSGEITGKNVSEVLEGLEHHKSSEQWSDKGGKFIPAVHKWLSDRAWKDKLKQSEVDSWAVSE